MPYLTAAYAVFWAITFGYVFSISARVQHAQREIEALDTELRRLENRR
jgi:CcmD family protein